jgi:hypothetical protein
MTDLLVGRTDFRTYIILHCIVLYCIALHYIVALHCIALHCIVSIALLHCIAY